MKVSKLKMVTCKTATAPQWNELMLYLRQHYKSDMIELSDYLTDYDYDDIREALIEYGIEDWLEDNDLMPGDEYEGEYFDPIDFEFDWPYYGKAIQESKMDDLTVNFDNDTYKNLKSFAEDEPDWEEFFDEKFAEMLK